MKLIVDIPEKYYEAYKEWAKTKTADAVQTIIANGIPYPRAEWRFDTVYHQYICSNCHNPMPNVNDYYRKQIIGCPYCLADMRKGDGK